jgi:hypothetical protein
MYAAGRGWRVGATLLSLTVLTARSGAGQGCSVALLGAGDLAAGGGIARAVNAIMRQFSGLATDADDMQAREEAQLQAQGMQRHGTSSHTHPALEHFRQRVEFTLPCSLSRCATHGRMCNF